MKQTTRKLLSLLTAFALVLTLAPTAWASGSAAITVSPADPAPGATVNLSLSGVTIPEGITPTYEWKVGDNAITGASGATATYQVPSDATAGSQLNFACTIKYTPSEESASEQTITASGTATVKAATTPITLGSISGGNSITYGSATGNSTSLSVTVNGTGADASKVQWSADPSSAVSLGTASTSGSTSSVTVTANEVTTATSVKITASYQGDTSVEAKEHTITVNPAAAAPTVKSVAFDSSSLSLTADGAAKNVKVTVTGSDDKAMPGQTVTVTQKEGDSATATASAATGTDGKATITVTPVAGKTGTTTFEASVGAVKSGLLTVTVTEAVASVTFSPTTLTLTEEESKDVTASVANSVDYDSVTWDRADNKITVTPYEGNNQNKATIRGGSAGNTKVTVTFKKGDKVVARGELSVKVNAPAAVSLELSASTLTFGNSDTKAKQLTATVKGTLPESATNYKVKFEVVTTSATGVVLISHDDPALNTNQTASTAITGKKNGTARIKATLYKGSTAVSGVEPQYCDVTVERTGYYLQTTATGNYPGEGTSHKLSAQNTITAPSSKTFSVTPYSYADGSTMLPSGVSVSYKWTLNSYTVQDNNSYWNYANQYTLSYDNQYLATSGRTLTCTATFRNATTGALINTDSISWTVSTDTTSQIPVGVTVFDSNPGYGLDDTPDAGNTGSIVDQIDSRVRSLYGNSYSHYTVTFSSVGGSSSSYKGYLDASTSRTYYDSDLEDITFVPNTTISTSTGSETVSFGFTVNVYRYSGAASSAYDARYTGTMTFTIKQGDSTSGDIFYSAEKGEDVSFDLDDFEDFWTDYQKNGSLSHITIDSISGGKLYTSDGKAVTTGDTLYASPSRSSQRDLDGVYFTPSSRTTSTGKVTFTASGSRTGSGSSYTRKGTVSISFLSGAASAIAYSTNASGSVTLKAQDFIDAYKEATGSRNNPTNLTIQFQNVPSYGTLTYRSGSRDVKLTSSNVKSYKLTAKASGTSQVESVTYSVSGSRTETISYTGYIGNTATFTGEVTFNAVTAPTNVNVYLPTCYSAAGVALSSSYFTTANAAMSGASYVILGSPRTGRLTGSAGSALAPNAVVQLGSLNTVTYVPTASGTDSFTFTAYNSSNTQVASGTVTVVSVLTTVTTPGAITSITQLTDIPTNATANWYRDKLTYLINKGMINGKGNGKFGPEDQVEYSEALKFIMNAAGIVREESKVGNWAQNYLNTAVQNGWVSGSVDLTKPIPRTAMAELTARILGIPASTAASPFADTNNQWVTALYNATFTANGTTGRIIQGSNDLNGRLCFNPDKQLTRAEMVTLVYNMYMYKGN